MTKERKYILIVGLILLIFGVMYRFYPSDLGLINRTSDHSLKEKKIFKYSEILGQKTDVEKHLKKLEQMAEKTNALFLKGDTSSLAAVNIQNILNQTANKVGLSISRIDIGKENKLEEKGVIGIPVSLRIVSTTKQLRDMIYHIESSKKMLRIIEINSNVLRQRKPEQINSKITVEGYIREH